MCSTTGSGALTKRTLSGVVGAPLASIVSRTMPAITGIRARTISPAGINQSAREESRMQTSSM
ncbi:MAG: hypothetical protein ABI216_06265 [Devosia sp.]